MSEATAGAGADTTPAAPAAPALETPVNASLLTDDNPAPTAGEGDAPAPETKDESKPGEGEAAPEGAPEAYEDFTTPEGVQLDPAVAEEFKGLAKDLGLSQEKAQKVADVIAKQTQAFTVGQTAEVQRVNAGWITETQNDKEIGGDKLPETLAAAKAAMEATTTPQLRELLKRTGLGNNVEVIRHFAKIAPAYMADKHVPGGAAPGGSTKTAAERLYPTS